MVGVGLFAGTLLAGGRLGRLRLDLLFAGSTIGAGFVLGAAYMLWMYQRVFFGPLTNPENKGLKDLTGREILYLAPLVILCFWIGLYPKPFFQVLEKPVNYVVAKVDPTYATAVAASAGSAPAQTAAAGE